MGNFNVQSKRIWKPVTLWDQFRFIFSSYTALWRYAIIMYKVEGNKFLVIYPPVEKVEWKGIQYDATLFRTINKANAAYNRLYRDAPDVEITVVRPVEIE